MALNRDKFNYIRKILEERILVLDGGIGTFLRYFLSNTSIAYPEYFFHIPDFLVVENSDIVNKMHLAYLEAGADIIKTNSFNCNKFMMSDYGRGGEKDVYDYALQAARIAKEAIELYKIKNPEKYLFVAGSVGPTSYMLSRSRTGSKLSFHSMSDAYEVCINGLLDGGADIILLETVVDSLNAEAALQAIDRIEKGKCEEVPVMVSVTLDRSGTLLATGQSIEEFYESLSNRDLLSVGINCGYGSNYMLEAVRRLSEMSATLVSAHPNAGLPDEVGRYEETLDIFATNIFNMLDETLVNIIGGCCGTTPEHISKIAELAKSATPRRLGRE